MTLEGMEGKMFAPLAYTIAIALGFSLLLSLTLSPVLSFFLLKGGSEDDTILVRGLKWPYLKLLNFAIHHRLLTIGLTLALFLVSLGLFPYLGTSFIPEMKEGTISPNIDRVPNISLEESIALEMESQKTILATPGIKSVVSRLGRGESPADPRGRMRAT